MNNINNLHMLRVNYGDNTVTVKSLRFNQSIRLNKWSNKRLHESDSYIRDLVIPELQSRGFNIVGKGEFGDSDIIVTDTFKGFSMS